MNSIKTIEWVGDARSGFVRILDQQQLPRYTTYVECRSVQSIKEAIVTLKVRGAPLIGVTAAYGMVLAAQQVRLKQATTYLADARPTAISLRKAVSLFNSVQEGDVVDALATAKALHDFEERSSKAIGDNGLNLIRATFPGVMSSEHMALTYCNAGSLATVGYGTALAPIYVATEAGAKIRVISPETRPVGQGLRLTAWELSQNKIPVTSICDNMIATLMDKVSFIIVGADRVTNRGDVINKIGTFQLALLAEKFEVPFYVAFPIATTVDRTVQLGSAVPIEQRSAEEVHRGGVIPGVDYYNPAFDVTPSCYVTSYITDQGVIEPSQILRTGWDKYFYHPEGSY